MEAINIANQMIEAYNSVTCYEDPYFAAYDVLELNKLSYLAQTEEGRIRQEAINLFEAWVRQNDIRQYRKAIS